MKLPIKITVNGRLFEREVEPCLLLVHFLRKVAALTGTKVGCDTSQCGSCTVLIDHKAVKSCTQPAVQADAAILIRPPERFATGWRPTSAPAESAAC